MATSQKKSCFNIVLSLYYFPPQNRRKCIRNSIFSPPNEKEEKVGILSVIFPLRVRTVRVNLQSAYNKRHFHEFNTSSEKIELQNMITPKHKPEDPYAGIKFPSVQLSSYWSMVGWHFCSPPPKQGR